MRIQGIFKLSKKALLFVLIVVSKYTFAVTDIDYKYFFGNEFDTSILTSKELMFSPLIAMGKREKPLKIHVNPLFDLLDIEAKPFLFYLKKYTNKETYNQVLDLKQTEFIDVLKLPDGVSLSLDENLFVVLNLGVDALMPIKPSLNRQDKFQRKPLSNILSSAHDINASITRLNKKNTPLINIDSSFRYNRLTLHGKSSYIDSEATYLKDDWLAKYEGSNHSYFYGNISNPVFSNINSKKIKTGFAIGNIDLRQNLYFDNDARYINLEYPADVKIFIDDILHEERSLEAGKHRLNIPIQDQLFDVRIEAEDIYGRKQEYDFSSIGIGMESIPPSPIYFTSFGKNSNNKKQFYAGIELGVDDTSKVQLSLNYQNNEKAIAGQYYRVLHDKSIKSTLILGRREEENGFGIKTLVRFGVGDNAEIITTHNYQNNLNLESVSNKDEHFIKFDLGYKFNDNLKVGSVIEQDLLEGKKYYSFSSKYIFTDDFDITLTHDRFKNQDKSSSVSFVYKFGDGATKVGSKHGFLDNSNYQNIRHEPSPDSHLDIERTDSSRTLNYSLKGKSFNSRVRVSSEINKETEYKLATNFSILTAKSSTALVRTIGDYYGFSIFETNEDFFGDLEIKVDSSSCKISPSSQCVLLVNPESERHVEYKLENIPLGTMIDPAYLSIMVPSRGGVSHKIKTRQMYFIKGFLTNADDEPIYLTIGKATNSLGNNTFVFTDETGAFVADLFIGDYSFTVPGYKSHKFSIYDNDNKNGYTNIGQIKLIKQD